MVEHASAMPRVVGPRLEGVAVAALGFAVAAGPAAHRGGYFAGTWSWLVLAACFVITVKLIASPTLVLGRLDVALLAGLGGLTGWVGLSSVWAPALTPAIGEATRLLAYLVVVLLALLVLRRATLEPLLVGMLVGATVVSGYALATRLAPDRVGGWAPDTGYRLADPIGYWNGLGVYAAMAALLAVGLAVRSRGRLVRALAGAAPPVLVATVLFTFSRGAWLALAVGLLAAFVLDPRRLQLAAGALALAAWPAILLVAAARSDTITSQTASLPQLIDAGESLAWLIVVTGVASAATALAFGELCDRVEAPAAVRRGFAGLLVVLALAGVGVLWAAEGAPWRAADRAWDAFTAAPKPTGSDVTGRLFDLSANGRIQLWGVSADAFRAHPAVGLGAGSFASEWFRKRDVDLYSREGHSLYAETLGEVGLVGVALLVAGLCVPLLAGWRARRHPLAVAALAPYCAFLAHAGVDWDWELAGVTLPALLAGASLVVLARAVDTTPRELGRVLRVALPATTGALAVVGLVLVLGNVSIDRARVANREGSYAYALAEADRAVRWAPWSSAALQERGRAKLGLGRPDEARRDLLSAVERTPNDAELWADLATASRGAQATAALRRAIELDPRNADLRRLLGRYRSPDGSTGS